MLMKPPENGEFIKNMGDFTKDEDLTRKNMVIEPGEIEISPAVTENQIEPGFFVYGKDFSCIFDM